MLEKELLHLIGKRKETHRISDIGTTLSHGPGHGFLGISIFIHKPVIGLPFFNHREAFPLQIFQDGDGGNVRIPFTAGGVPVFSKNTRDVVHQFFACQWALPTDLIYMTKTTG